MTKEKCDDQNCLMKNPLFWKEYVLFEVRGILCQLSADGIEKSRGFVDCQLKKVRLRKLADQLFRDISHMKIDDVGFPSKFEKINKNLESLKTQWTLFWNGSTVSVSICKCTPIWKKTRKAIDFTRVKDVDAWKRFLDLKKSIERMVNYSPEEELDGCPMNYNHGIVLDPLVLQELEDAYLEDFYKFFLMCTLIE